jgi:glycosyltransferase involved in cell wall biosynthesis
MDATVFASYYEPWGYTPLESVAFGVPTVTTSLSGFGSWINTQFKNSFADCGVNVIERNDSNYHDVCNSIVDSLVELHNNIGKYKKASMNTAKRAAWSNFMTYYGEAYNMALRNAENR